VVKELTDVLRINPVSVSRQPRRTPRAASRERLVECTWRAQPSKLSTAASTCDAAADSRRLALPQLLSPQPAPARLTRAGSRTVARQHQPGAARPHAAARLPRGHGLRPCCLTLASASPCTACVYCEPPFACTARGSADDSHCQPPTHPPVGHQGGFNCKSPGLDLVQQPHPACPRPAATQ